MTTDWIHLAIVILRRKTWCLYYTLGGIHLAVTWRTYQNLCIIIQDHVTETEWGGGSRMGRGHEFVIQSHLVRIRDLLK